MFDIKTLEKGKDDINRLKKIKIRMKIVDTEIPLIIKIIEKINVYFPQDFKISSISDIHQFLESLHNIINSLKEERLNLINNLLSVINYFEPDNDFKDHKILDEDLFSNDLINPYLEKILGEIAEIEIKYKSKQKKNFIPRLKKFNGYKYLSEYSHSAFDINDKSQLDLLLKMDHILFKIIKQNYLSLRSLLKYEIKGQLPKDLDTSYKYSIKVARNLIDEDGSFLWFTNMKNPETYGTMKEVQDHYKGINEVLTRSTKIDARRIHLFYDMYNIRDNEVAECNSKYLFTYMLIEILHGMDCKVLLVKDKNMLEEIIEGNKKAGYKISDLFLLDYAINYSTRPNDIRYLKGKRNVLCADFSAESILTDEGDLQKKRSQYKKEKVFVFDGPLLFSIFKHHYLSIWNLDEYIKYINERYEGDDEIILSYKDLYSCLEIMDFFSFCKYSCYSMKELLHEGIFEKLYIYNEAKNKRGLSKSEVTNVLNEVIDLDGGSLSFKEDFLDKAEKIILRKIHYSLYY